MSACVAFSHLILSPNGRLTPVMKRKIDTIGTLKMYVLPCTLCFPLTLALTLQVLPPLLPFQLPGKIVYNVKTLCLSFLIVHHALCMSLLAGTAKFEANLLQVVPAGVDV